MMTIKIVSYRVKTEKYLTVQIQVHKKNYAHLNPTSLILEILMRFLSLIMITLNKKHSQRKLVRCQ